MKTPRYYILLILLLGIPIFLNAQSVKPVDLEIPKVIFTDPEQFEDVGLDPALMLQINALINATPSGEEITVCVFKFEIVELAESFLEAQNRGVKVRLILNDGKTSDEANEKVYSLFKKELDDFHFIKNNISDKGIIHNKFILFSRVLTREGDLNHVIVQTSANFQRKGAKKLQDMIVLSDRRIYYGYIDFWYDIKVLGEADQLAGFDYFESKSEDERYKASFFPKRKKEEEFGKDNIVKILKNVEEPSKTEIRFAHGKWTENRKDIVEELNELRKDGAKVEVITNKDLEDEIKKDLKDLKEGVYYLDKSYKLHTKFFLLEEDGNRQVWTGSHNLTNRSLRENFEVLLMIDDPEIYQEYLGYYKKIKKLVD